MLPGFSQRLHAGRDVDAVAKNVAAFDDDVAEIDPDAHGDALLVRQSWVFLLDRVAQGGGAARRLDDAFELDQRQVLVCLKMFPPYSEASGSMMSVKTALSPAKLSASSPGNSRL